MPGRGRQGRPEWRASLAVVAVGCALTSAVAWRIAETDADLRRRELHARSERLAGEVERVVTAHTAVLYGVRSLHIAGGPLTRRQFHQYVVDGGLLDQYPGAQAFELVRRVPAADVAEFEAAVRADTSVDPSGYPAFAVHPASVSADRWVVDFVEPMATNAQAFGLDLGAEDDRRRALLQARDDGAPHSTAPLRLVQETEGEPGLLVLLPLYDSAAIPSTVEARRAACVGFALVVYRVGDMLEPVRASNADLAFQVRDVGPAGGGALSSPSGIRPFASGDLGSFTDDVELEVHGRRWVIRTSLDGPSPTPSLLALGIGLVATGVLTLFVFHLAATRRTATARARVLAASDAQRRNLERDLHDGAQQRLLSVSLLLARVDVANAQSDDPIAVARQRIEESLAELRELAAGIHPAVVSDHGLDVALQQVAGRAPVPVTVDVRLDGRPPQPLEVAAYYVASEAMANVAKHAKATRAEILVSAADGWLEIAVVDDGVGGADPARGSGLRGLIDRVEALGGHLDVSDIADGGTRLRVRMPCA